MTVPMSLLEAMCREAGLSPARVIGIDADARAVRFEVISVDPIDGGAYWRGDVLVTHTVTHRVVR